MTTQVSFAYEAQLHDSPHNARFQGFVEQPLGWRAEFEPIDETQLSPLETAWAFVRHLLKIPGAWHCRVILVEQPAEERIIDVEIIEGATFRQDRDS